MATPTPPKPVQSKPEVVLPKGSAPLKPGDKIIGVDNQGVVIISRAPPPDKQPTQEQKDRARANNNAPINPDTGKAQTYNPATGKYQDTPYTNINIAQSGSSFSSRGSNLPSDNPQLVADVKKAQQQQYYNDAIINSQLTGNALLPSQNREYERQIREAQQAGYQNAAIVNSALTGNSLLPSDMKTIKGDIQYYKNKGVSNADIVNGLYGESLPKPKENTSVKLPAYLDVTSQTIKQNATRLNPQTGNIILDNQTKNTSINAKSELNSFVNATSRAFGESEGFQSFIVSPLKGVGQQAAIARESLLGTNQQVNIIGEFRKPPKSIAELKVAEEEVQKAQARVFTPEIKSALIGETLLVGGVAIGGLSVAGTTVVAGISPVAGKILGTGFGLQMGYEAVKETIKAPKKLLQGMSPGAVVLDIVTPGIFARAGLGEAKTIPKAIVDWANKPAEFTASVGKTRTTQERVSVMEAQEIPTSSSKGAVSKGVTATFLEKPVSRTEVFAQTDITRMKIENPVAKALGLTEDVTVLGDRTTTVKSTLAEAEIFSKNKIGRGKLVINTESVSTVDTSQPRGFVASRNIITETATDITPKPNNRVSDAFFSNQRESIIDAALKSEATQGNPKVYEYQGDLINVGTIRNDLLGKSEKIAETRDIFKPRLPTSKETAVAVPTQETGVARVLGIDSTIQMVSRSKSQTRLGLKIKNNVAKVSGATATRTQTANGFNIEGFEVRGRITTPKKQARPFIEISKPAEATSPFEEATQKATGAREQSRKNTIVDLTSVPSRGSTGKVTRSKTIFNEEGVVTQIINLQGEETKAQFGRSKNRFTPTSQSEVSSEFGVLTGKVKEKPVAEMVGENYRQERERFQATQKAKEQKAKADSFFEFSKSKFRSEQQPALIDSRTAKPAQEDIFNQVEGIFKQDEINSKVAAEKRVEEQRRKELKDVKPAEFGNVREQEAVLIFDEPQAQATTSQNVQEEIAASQFFKIPSTSTPQYQEQVSFNQNRVQGSISKSRPSNPLLYNQRQNNSNVLIQRTQIEPVRITQVQRQQPMTILRQGLVQVQTQALKQSQALKSRSQLKQTQQLKTQQQLKQTQVLKQESVLKTELKPVSILRTGLLVPRPPRPVPPPPTTVVPVFPFNANDAKPKEQKSSGFFNIISRKGGKEIRINAAPIKNVRSAFGIAQNVVGGTARASFKIINTKTGKEVSSPSVSSQFYKNAKTGFYVEKNKFRINTGGEKQQITNKGISASRVFKKKNSYKLFSR